MTRPRWLADEGGMAAHVRTFDWSATPIGPLEAWPRSLRTAVEIALSSRYPMFVWWGRELINIYNDAYAPMLGGRHPAALGQPAPQLWHEIWSLIEPLTAAVLDEARSTWNDDSLLVLERNGYPEEAYFTFSYSPLWDGDAVVGLFGVVIENTQRVLGERRLRTLRELAADTSAEALSADAACRCAAASLAGNPYDLPFVLIYRLEDGARAARLVASTGLAEGSPAMPPRVELAGEAAAAPTWPLREVLAGARAVEMADLGATFPPLVAGSWPEPVHTAMVLPIHWQERVVGFVVAGISPRRPLDDAYRDFCGLLAGHVGTAIANAEAHEAERRRAEALAEIDRAKTAFFSNISHELRTPLTLMLAPLEEVVDAPAAADRELLRVVLRNGLRLQKLVNSLLDFSRLEAGRIQACYEPTDLAALTSELASTFRSACERAGVRFVVDCGPLDQPVYVDRDMWEKVILNLLSNAFKFTLAGEIEVAMRAAGGHVEMTVRDTGIGIPAEAMPHLFERFYRVEGAVGRTQEGSGIGLALVRELVRLHGGEVTAESRPGQGSLFTVRVPFGKEHLDAERISARPHLASTALGAAPFVEEALRWLPDQLGSELSASSVPTVSNASTVPPARRPRVLLADDNADMRQYLVHLLGERFEVTAVGDGEAALAAVRAEPPDLLLADVMMPRRDGFALLRELRAAEETRTLPVILLSARAGEEARIEGLMAGADDYVVKPFGARELIARVAGALALAEVRGEALHHERERRLVVEALRHAESERLELLASEREARAAAERANRVKDDFLATVSHELRTPMNTVLLWVEAIRQHQLAPATIERGLGTIERAVKTQVKLIEDLLDLSRIATGKLVLADEPLGLDAAVQLAIEIVGPVAQEKGVTLRSRFAGGPWPMRGDATRLQQVAWNLVANAVKFTPRGGSVEVALERRDGKLTIGVHDTGQGIDGELLPHVFERFRQGEGAPSRVQGGLGIGLAIVKRLVELHGGSVHAASPGVDQGATFVVELPAATEAAASGGDCASAAEAASLEGVRVLLVEDDQDTRELVARILSERKALVTTASSVDAALTQLAAVRPEVLISDISMPDKDGYSLIREVRGSPLHRGLPAVALTAFARPGDRTRALEAGFDRHVTKPVDMGELCATVASLLRERRAEQPAS